MEHPDDKRRGPGGKSEAPEDRWQASENSLPRCAICRHVITARESIATGVGRDCRRRLRAHKAVAA